MGVKVVSKRDARASAFRTLMGTFSAFCMVDIDKTIRDLKIEKPDSTKSSRPWRVFRRNTSSLMLSPR
jgi:hypothetical protein